RHRLLITGLRLLRRVAPRLLGSAARRAHPFPAAPRASAPDRTFPDRADTPTYDHRLSHDRFHPRREPRCVRCGGQAADRTGADSDSFECPVVRPYDAGDIRGTLRA